MKTFNRRRLLIAFAIYAIAALALGGVALAGATKKKHHNSRTDKKKTFAPLVITRAAEVSAVELDPYTQQFLQVTFDRGRITTDSSSAVTIQQAQGGAIWRTQTFTVPSNAVVTLNGKSAQLSQIPTGSAASIESSGAVGSSLSVVRVRAFSHGEAPLPEMTSS
ncbi:MAG TPA: hypothetical protein VGH52_09740 [Gaiellaceae bacterium]|jgi:hypothetical protein